MVVSEIKLWSQLRLLAVRREFERLIVLHAGARFDPLEDGGPFAYGGFASGRKRRNAGNVSAFGAISREKSTR